MNESIRKTFWFNLAVVIVLCVALYMLFFASLSFITRHGKEVKVPDATNRFVKTAVAELEKLGFEVDIDSAYDPKKKAYMVLSQVPDVNSVVKKGRTIFLTINKAEPPLTSMPNLLNLSFRSAELILKSNKLKLGDTTYRPDIAKGAILEQLYNGKPIRPGQMVPQGSRISLIIGDGLGNTQFNVPDVIGARYEEAIAILNANGLVFTAIWDGEITDSAKALVYSQSPSPVNELGAPNRIQEGDIIDIRIKQDPSYEEMEYNRNPSKPVDDGEETTEELEN